MFKPQGVRNFERCPHKQVAFIDRENKKGQVLGIGSASLECPNIENTLEVTAITAPNRLRIYDYSSTGSGRYYTDRYRGPAEAQRHLAKVAGEVACANCSFATMTKSELSSYQTQELIDQAAYDRAEIDAINSAKALEQARRDVNQINDQYGIA